MIMCRGCTCTHCSKLCTEEMTCFEPETCSQLVTGMEFHKFYFDHCKMLSYIQYNFFVLLDTITISTLLYYPIIIWLAVTFSPPPPSLSLSLSFSLSLSLPPSLPPSPSTHTHSARQSQGSTAGHHHAQGAHAGRERCLHCLHQTSAVR